MKTDIKIRDFSDIVRILRENPEWMEEMRKLILTDELINFPKKFEKYEEEEFKPLKNKVGKIEKSTEKLEGEVKLLKGDVEVLKEDVEVLKEDVKILKEDVKILKEDVKVLKEDVGVLKEDSKVMKGDIKKLKDDMSEIKGDNFERRVKEKAPAFFGKLIRKCRVIGIEDLQDVLERGVDENVISEKEKEEAILIDLVVKGNLKESKEDVLLAVEISSKVDVEDVERAFKRANIFYKVYNIKTIPVALGKEFSEKAKEVAEKLSVLLI